MRVTHSEVADTEESFAKSAGRQLLLFALIAVGLLAGLMWALQVLAGLVGSSTVEAKAVDPANNSITISIRQEPPQLDTTHQADSVSGMVLGHVMEGLLRMGMDDRIEPGIAYRWLVEDDSATFWLRDTARWSDGQPITAHDFVFAWRTVVSPENASKYAFLLYPVKNARAINEGNLSVEHLGVQAVDDRTLTVKLERPLAYFDKLVAFQTFFPIREDFYRSTQGRYAADAWELLYSGPFMIKQWVHGDSLLLERNPHYWDQERLSLQRINIAYITEDAIARLNFFKDGRIAEAVIVAENLHEAMERRWPIFQEPDGTLFFLEFNHRPERATRNRNLRRAMQYALDMEELIYKVTKLPGYVPGESLFPRWLPGKEQRFREEHPAPELMLDLTKARHHLELAKQELGVERIPQLALLSGDTPVANIQAEWLQAELKHKLGIEVLIDSQIFKQRLAKMSAGEFDLVLAGWGPDYDDALTFGDLFASWNQNNRGEYKSARMDAYIDTAQNSLDPDVRMRAFAGIQQLVFDDAVILPMYERGVTYVLHPQLKNVKRRVIGAEVDFTNAYIEAGP